MSIGLVIENIAGSLRQTPPLTAAAGQLAGTAISGSGAGTATGLPSSQEASGLLASQPNTQPNTQPNSQPASGQGQLTPGFTVLVLQLLNDQGTVVATIPTAQQLAAYRTGTATPPS